MGVHAALGIRTQFLPAERGGSKIAAECPLHGLGFVVIHKQEVLLGEHMRYTPLTAVRTQSPNKVVHADVLLVCGIYRCDH